MAEIKWTVHEYIGSPVYRMEGDQIIQQELRKEEDLKVGDTIAFSGLSGFYRGVISGSDGHLTAVDPVGVGTLLEFNQDDRHCWVSGGIFNLKAIQKLDLNG